MNADFLLNRSKKNIYSEIKIKTLEEEKYFSIFKRNVLWNFYKTNRPKIMTDAFIRLLEEKIRILNIMLTPIDNEIMTSLKTESFNTYRALKKLPSPSNNNVSKWIYYRIDNCTLYETSRLNLKKEDSPQEKLFKTYKKTSVVKTGSLCFGNESFIINDFGNKNTFELKYIDIKYLKCHYNYIAINSKNKIYLLNIYLDNINLFKLGLIRLRLHKKIKNYQ